jgi:8-oxo-dGTP diphosphatase/2-hydroxy-dATP diphosphatase
MWYMQFTKDGRLLLTLCIVQKDGAVLLGMKKRGFGAGKWNGFGGKVDVGETIEESAHREVVEEAGIVPQDLTPCGVIHFDFLEESLSPGEQLEVHLFTISQFEGKPTESDEMRPEWYSFDDIPYADMWPDDEFWLPHILAGNSVTCSFSFGKDNALVDNQVVVLKEKE